MVTPTILVDSLFLHYRIREVMKSSSLRSVMGSPGRKQRFQHAVQVSYGVSIYAIKEINPYLPTTVEHRSGGFFISISPKGHSAKT